jgi:hypothetical protein
MSIKKMVSSVAAAGLLICLGLYFFKPEYTATAVVSLTSLDRESPAPEVQREMVEIFSENLARATSDDSLSLIVQSPAVDLYKEERRRLTMPQINARIRAALNIALQDSASPNVSTYRIAFRYPDRKKALDFENALIARLIGNHQNALKDLTTERDRALQNKINDLKERITALEARLGAIPTQNRPPAPLQMGADPLEPWNQPTPNTAPHLRYPVTLQVVDPPTVSARAR